MQSGRASGRKPRLWHPRLVSLLAILAIPVATSNAEDSPSASIGKAAGPTSSEVEDDRRISEALQRKISVHYDARPLREFLEDLSRTMSTRIVVHTEALRKAAVAVDDPVTINCDDIRAKSILNLILEPLNLTYTIIGDALKITTREQARKDGEVTSGERYTREALQGVLTVRFDRRPLRIAVADILFLAGLHAGVDQAGLAEGSVELKPVSIDCLETATGEILHRILEPRGLTYLIEEDCYITITSRRKASNRTPESVGPDPQLLPEWSDVVDEAAGVSADLERPRIGELLNRRVTLRFENRPLREVVREIAAQASLDFILDSALLPHAAASPVSGEVTSLRARHALKVILRRHGLSYTIRDRALRLTPLVESEDSSAGHLLTVYRVADLLAPPAVLRIPFSGREARLEAARQFVTQDRIAALVDQLQTSVVPESWEEFGGLGTIAVSENAASLAIRQSQDMHDRIATFLAQRRRLGDVDVSLSVTAVRLPGNAPFDPPDDFELADGFVRVAVLEADRGHETRQALHAIAWARSIDLPKATLGTGGALDLEVPVASPTGETEPTEMTTLRIVSVVPSASMVRLHFARDNERTSGKGVVVADRESLLVEVTGGLAGSVPWPNAPGHDVREIATDSKCRLLLLIVPRVKDRRAQPQFGGQPW